MKRRIPRLKYVWALQEASVVAMADGYAQAAGRPGFINLHTAGGLGHGLGNLLNASVSCTPLVVTAGQQDRRHSLTDPLLLGDLVSIARPAVKWAQEVGGADQLPVLVRRAFQDANAAPSGPVFLSLPMDVMEEMSTVPVDAPSTIDRRSVAGSLEALADHLAGIRPNRLAIIAGDEIHSSDAADEALELAETLAAPVFGSSFPARIPFATSSPLWAGNLPTKATESFRNIGWAASDGTYGTGVDLDSALDRLSARLRSAGRAAIGFEAPIWTPARSDLTIITGTRGGIEKKFNRAWSAGAGCGALGAALVLMPYCFSRILSRSGPIPATVDLDRFVNGGGLLVWEAFVSGTMKVAGTTHHDDARVACDEFIRRWPTPQSDIPEESATNHAMASAMSVGLMVDAAELKRPALVVGVSPTSAAALPSSSIATAH